MGGTLVKYHGLLDEETAEELATIVERRREERADTHRERVEKVADEFDR